MAVIEASPLVNTVNHRRCTVALAKNIRAKRVYAAPSEQDGVRVLVDRLWPRGVSKERARIDYWLKEVAPSDALRKRFHGKPGDWEAFRSAYAKELERPPACDALAELKVLAEQGRVTLIYASRDEARNNAEALRRLLIEGK